MINEVYLGIIDYSSFIIFVLILTLILGIYLNYKFKRFKFDIKNIKLYSLFLNLDRQAIISFSASLIKYMFIIWHLILMPEFSTYTILLLILLSLIGPTSIDRYISIIPDLFNSGIEYTILILIKYLIEYLKEVNVIWYVVLMIILLIILIIISSTYSLFKRINDILVREKKQYEK